MSNEEIILVEADGDLKCEQLYWTQWMITRNARDIDSRRDLLDEMSLTFVKHPELRFKYRDGSDYEFPEIDEIFEDSEMRWASLHLECDGSNLYPRRHSSKTERLRLLNIFLKVRYPFLRHILEGSVNA